MPGMGGGKRAKAKQKAQVKSGKGAKRSGNPAKRAAGPESPAAVAPAAGAGLGAFGLGGQSDAELEAALGDLPPEFRNLLG
jgi:signal recognition particle subunit SRP54